MDLKEYLKNRRGTGVLATSGAGGEVNAALYSKPQFMDDGTVAFIMNDRLSRRNLLENPKAAYLFMDGGVKREGIRVYLEKTGEDDNRELIGKLRRHGDFETDAPGKKLFLVFFRIVKTRPLVDPEPGG